MKRRTKPVRRRTDAPRHPQLRPIDRRTWREDARAAVDPAPEASSLNTQPPSERLAG